MRLVMVQKKMLSWPPSLKRDRAKVASRARVVTSSAFEVATISELTM